MLVQLAFRNIFISKESTRLKSYNQKKRRGNPTNNPAYHGEAFLRLSPGAATSVSEVIYACPQKVKITFSADVSASLTLDRG